MIISKIDGTKCKNLAGLSIHLKKYGKSLVQYYIEYENFKIPICENCKRERLYWKGISFRKTCGDSNCLKKLKQSLVLSEESKNKIRIARFNFLKNINNRRKTSWYARSKNEMTYGEKTIHNIFIKNKIYDKYEVINEYPLFPYFIDFAFINEKIAFEFDGKCHFKNKKRIEHDIKRDYLLKLKGWKTYRVSYKELNTFSIDNFISFIGNSNKEPIKNQLQKYSEYKTDKNAIKEKNTDKEKTKIIKDFIEKLLTSDIEFNKFGWVNKAAKILNKKPQKINSWMKVHMNDFYETSCFKRNNNMQ